jgi:hypothetical protein
MRLNSIATTVLCLSIKTNAKTPRNFLYIVESAIFEVKGTIVEEPPFSILGLC